jgi:TusA-related sulfurtransferase
MSETVDARGLSCPVPVIRTKEVLDGDPEGEVTVLLDEEVAKENVSRLARGMGWSVEVREDGDEYELTLRRAAGG